jgi:ubiquinone/menaquinone biosynthesis C-methylase UbiE
MVNVVDEKAFREFEREAHDRIANSYHSFFVPITEHAAEPLLDAAEVRAGLRVLDVASGSGVVAAHAARRSVAVTGVDLSSRMVSLAAALNPTCLFREADVESLPFADESFDAVVCAFGIGHFPQSELAVAECARVLSRKGWLAFSWWDMPARNRLHGVILEAVQEADAKPPANLPAGPPMFRYSEDGEFRRLLASPGLESATISSHTFTYRLPSADALWEGAMGSLARTSALLRAQTREVQQRIRTAFERLANAYLTPAGLDLPVAFKVCRARKPTLS